MPVSAPPVINGTRGAYAQPLRYGCNDSGPYMIQSFSGTLAEIEALIPMILWNRGQYEVKRGIGVHTIEARYSLPQGGVGGGAEVPVDNWEFFAAKVEKDMLETDNAAINSLSSANKNILRNLIANPRGPADDPVTIDDFDADGSEDTAYGVYFLMLDGMRSIRVNAPTLRHTQTVSNMWTVKAALTNVGKILSTATLLLFENIPSDVLFNLPTDVTAKEGFHYGWFKLHPTVRSAARMKMQIELEYEYGLWPDLIYLDPL